MKQIILISIVLLSGLGILHADLMVYTPEAAGNIGGYFPLQNAFDAPPSTIPTVDGAAISGYTDAGLFPGGYANRWGYIDFGADYASLKIAEAWTGYRPYSSSHVASPYQNVFWSSSISTNSAGTTVENNINFMTETTVAHVNALLFYQDWAAASPAEYITPAERYLILNSASPMSDRAAEYVILTAPAAAIPEPGSLSLLMFLTLGAVALRRLSA